MGTRKVTPRPLSCPQPPSCPARTTQGNRVLLDTGQWAGMAASGDFGVSLPLQEGALLNGHTVGGWQEVCQGAPWQGGLTPSPS